MLFSHRDDKVCLFLYNYKRENTSTLHTSALLVYLLQFWQIHMSLHRTLWFGFLGFLAQLCLFCCSEDSVAGEGLLFVFFLAPSNTWSSICVPS